MNDIPYSKTYCPVLTVEGLGHGRGHLVKINGKTAYYRPYDGSVPDEIAQEAYAALARVLGRHLGYPEQEPADETDEA